MSEKIKTAAAVLLLICLLVSCAFAEEHGDLEKRFADVEKIEYEGKMYVRRARNEATLILVIADKDADSLGRVGFLAYMTIDDNLKRITPVVLDTNLMVQYGAEMLRISDLYGRTGDAEADCETLMCVVNGLLGTEAVEHYVAVDLSMLESVCGVNTAMDDPVTDRLRRVKDVLETKSSKQLSQMYENLGGSLITDMKSGAVMKIADKADRYERLHSVYAPGEPVAAANGEEAFYLDTDVFRAMNIEIFYRPQLKK